MAGSVSNDVIQWGTIVSTGIGAAIGGAIGMVGNYLNNQFQKEMQKERWSRENLLKTAEEHKESDAAVLREIRPYLQKLFEEFSKMAPSISVKSGGIHVSTEVDDPSNEFADAGNKILLSKTSAKLIDPELKKQMEGFEATLDNFSRQTGLLTAQRNSRAPGTEMMIIHNKRKEILKAFQKDYEALMEYIAKHIGHHRLDDRR